MIKVLIAANEPIFSIGLKTLLKDNLYLNVIEENNVTTNILNSFDIHKPDLLILSLETNNLLELSPHIKKITKKSKVIIFSSFTNKELTVI